MVRNRHKTGFTMIELLAVAALIGILASISVLRYSKMGSQTVLTNQTRQLYLIAKYARVAAIEQQKPFILKLDENQQQIFLQPALQSEQADSSISPLSQNQMSATTETMVLKNAYTRPLVLDKKLMVEQFLLDGCDGRQSECVFYPDGKAQACMIQLGDGLRHAYVMITQTGRVSMQNGIAEQLQTGRVDLDSKE